MQSILREIAAGQLPSGQISTIVTNTDERWQREVSTMTPTYLVCLLLTLLRDRTSSTATLDRVISRGVHFLEKMAYRDPIEGLMVWHFNAFYPPDWEETLWCSWLLHGNGLVTKNDLEPLRKLLLVNETMEQGVGVWIKDDYSQGNGHNNAFDPVVSLSVRHWLGDIFGTVSEPTERYIQKAIQTDMPSLYYSDTFKNFFFWVLGKTNEPKAPLLHDGNKLFHHGERVHVWYESKDVWDVVKLLVA